VIAVLLAALAGGVLLWTVKGHRTSDPAVPVAIVNLDAPVTTGSGSDQKTVAAGRLLAANLSQPSPAAQTPLSWQLLDQDDAKAGLDDGKFYGVLTIPEGFSAAITSTSGTDPQQAQLTLVTNNSESAAVAALTQGSVRQAALALGDQVTSSYVDNLLQSITNIHNSLSSSASSATTLASSSEQLASSSHQLADSTSQVASGAQSLDQGSASLASGAATLASGAAQAATGAAQVASGTTSLATGAGQLSQGATSAASGAATLASSAQQVSTGAKVLANQSADLQTGLGRVDTNAGRLADGSAAIASRAQDVAAACPREAGAVYCERVAVLARESAVQADATRALQAGVRVEAGRSVLIAKGAAGLSTADSALASGATQLSAGTSQLSDGANALSAGATTLSSGASQVATGTKSVATGASQTSAGATSVAQGAAQLADGTSQLASGSSQLASGADQLASGNDQLATGLTNGASQVPSYTDDQRSQIVTVVTTPVQVGAEATSLANVATSLIPLVLALTLWLGTFMMFLTRSPGPTGPAWAQATARRRVLFGLLPAFLVGLLLATIVLGLLALSGIFIGSLPGLAGLAVLGALAFAAVNQALVAMFGAVGRMVSLAFLAIQSAALGGLVPIETAPGLVQLLNGFLPVPQFVTAASRLLLDGSGNVTGACVVLVGWSVLAVAASILLMTRRRPELAAPARPPTSPDAFHLSLVGNPS
jgi:putative membrane protein